MPDGSVSDYDESDHGDLLKIPALLKGVPERVSGSLPVGNVLVEFFFKLLCAKMSALF
jgi:hypothetical protein